MDSAPPETKRPRLMTGPSWSAGTPQHGVSLPHPTPHHTAHAPYQPQNPYSRPPEPPPAPAHHHPDDRRQHEPEFYAPMQDHHRQPPPPSPAHPPYPPYAPRDPLVKRDPGDDPPLSHLRRPNSTGNVADGLPPGPHGPPPPHLPQHPEDPRRPMSFDSGAPMAPSPTIYRPPPSYPPTPVPHHPQYEAPVYGHPPPGQAMYPVMETQNAKRKAQRASQACDSCRQLKAKCDETKPCKNCKEKGVKCNYREPTVKQPDKATADILDMLTLMKDEMTNGFAEIKRLEQRVSGIESTLKRISSDAKIESVEGDDDRPDMPPSSPALTAKEEGIEESAASPTATLVGPQLTVDEAQATLRGVDDDVMEDPPGPPVEPGRPAMPPVHTTLAGLLLKWGPISKMVQHLLEKEKIRHVEEFPIRQEMQRGMIRVFGYGEGFDQEIRTSDFVSQADQAMTDIHDDYSDIASPAPLGEAWGQLGGIGPAPQTSFKTGVINTDGNPDYDPTKVWEYVQSFKDNILNMHPIIIPRELDAMVKLFLETLPPSRPKQGKASSSSSARFVHQPASSVPPFIETGSKRKRSPAVDEPTSSPFQKPGRGYRTIHSALVLLVLALGKICLHRDPIPDVVRETPDAPTPNSPLIRNGFPASPLQGSPPGVVSQSQSSGLPSPREIERGMSSRRPSIQGLPPATKGIQMKRNMDVIPGLEYFALATDIIGSHVAGHNLKHVYVFILAGLYHGQLGRIIESWSYINLASTRLHAILRPSLKRLSRLKEETKTIETRRDNQMAFAFWTCLQLESDILAELPLAQSPIMQHEDQMPYPNLVLANSQGFAERVLQGYSAQLYLRKKLNQVHNLLYDQRRSGDPRLMVQDMEIDAGIRRIQAEVKESRNYWVPEDYRWADDDPPAPDILSARLRAKYWGSQVIIYRLYIRAILEGDVGPTNWGYREAGANGQVLSPTIEPRILESAQLGIRALIESTRAFHGMDSSQRLIITNVFGTAHAQWGNLIILAACYKHPILCQFVESSLLANLFVQTIKFFDTIAQPSSGLMVDRNILVGLARDLDLVKPDEFDPKTTSSFSSVASGPLPPMQNPSENYIPSSPAVFAQSQFAPPPPQPNNP